MRRHRKVAFAFASTPSYFALNLRHTKNNCTQGIVVQSNVLSSLLIQRKLITICAVTVNTQNVALRHSNITTFNTFIIPSTLTQASLYYRQFSTETQQPLSVNISQKK